MPKVSSHIFSIIKQLEGIKLDLSTQLTDVVLDALQNSINSLLTGNYQAAYNAAKMVYEFSGKPIKELNVLFHGLLFAEDVVSPESIVLIHTDSPYRSSLIKISKELGFTVQEHQLSSSHWTKDYVVSSGRRVLAPIKESSDYMQDSFMDKAKANKKLYYKSLGISEHHASKATLPSTDGWGRKANKLLTKTTFVRKTMLEGGNFFCAVNKNHKRFYLIGENVLSDTMAFNNVTRAEAIVLISNDLSCTPKSLLFIPQWTYHLDLQMAYLGKGQFIIHSFDQNEIDFGLNEETRTKTKDTFAYLKEQFEEHIIDATCRILTSHGFEVQKVFGCLFYLNDCTDPNELKHVPYCKNSDGFDGALALLMNGIAVDLEEKGRHFIALHSDVTLFREQFVRSLQALGIEKVHGVDMLEAYDCYGYFEGLAAGVWGAQNVTQVAAFMNGALRCQTSIISKNISPVHNVRGTQYGFFKIADRMGLMGDDKYSKKTDSESLENDENRSNPNNRK